METSAPAAMAVGSSALMCILFAGLAFVGLCLTALWIWMLIDCLTKETDVGNSRLIWALVIVLTHAIGALIYLLVRRPARKAELGK